jgi:lipopolysaccharide/colanic/teichoic acid biosynthesis glycosyltransferase
MEKMEGFYFKNFFVYKFFFKRFFDIIVSVILILIILPFLFFVFILIKVDSRGSFFFFQERLGYQGSIFKVYKIRTMTDKKRFNHTEVFKDNPEVTKVGFWLRRFKIDELPQLINVLKGDMSIVGPRPGLTSQIEEFNEDGKIRLLARPGLTGLAQVNGNIHLTWPERWKFDKKYVEKINFLLDLKIILKTILIVLVGEEKFLNKPNA